MSAHDEWNMARFVETALSTTKAIRGSGRTLLTLATAINQAKLGKKVIVVVEAGARSIMVERISELSGVRPLSAFHRRFEFDMGEGGSLEVLGFTGEKTLRQMLEGHTGKRVHVDHYVLEVMVVQYARSLCSQWGDQ